MSQFSKTYLDEVIRLLEMISDEELPGIKDAAKLLADVI